MADVAGSLLTSTVPLGQAYPDKRRAAYQLTAPLPSLSNPDKRRPTELFTLSEGSPITPVTTRYFKMRAQDSGAAPPGYVTWTAMGTPDFAGTGYSGGTPTPVGPMVSGSAIVADEWTE